MQLESNKEENFSKEESSDIPKGQRNCLEMVPCGLNVSTGTGVHERPESHSHAYVTLTATECKFKFDPIRFKFNLILVN